MNQRKKRADRQEHERNKLSLLNVEDALKGARATGKPPEPHNKHAKRTATKRRLKGEGRPSQADGRL